MSEERGWTCSGNVVGHVGGTVWVRHVGGWVGYVGQGVGYVSVDLVRHVWGVGGTCLRSGWDMLGGGCVTCWVEGVEYVCGRGGTCWW